MRSRGRRHWNVRPDVIAGRIDVNPAERRQAAKSLIIDGDEPPTKHRFVDPKGELRADGTKLLKLKGRSVSLLTTDHGGHSPLMLASRIWRP